MTPAKAPAHSPILHRVLNKQYPVAARGEGVWLFDQAGKRYLDFTSSAVVNFIGHGDREIARAMAEQAAQLEFVHSSNFTTEVAERFAQEILDFAGPAYHDGSVFFTSGGSEAVESALKLARQYQVEAGHSQRFQIVSRRQSYHGATLGAMAVSGNESRRGIYLPMLREFPKANIPNGYRCAYNCGNGCLDCGEKYAAEVEEAISETQGTAAGFIMESLSGATLGAVAPPASYAPRVVEICRKHNVLLIADEVMTGFGRTGRNFAMQHWDVTPDIIALGKGISSGYAPLGAIIAQRHVGEAIANGTGSLLHGFTYNAHPVSVAAGRAVLQRIVASGLVEPANSSLEGGVASALRSELERLWSLETVGDIRGLGLLWAVEFVADKPSKRPFPAERKFAAQVSECALRRGLLLYPMQGCADGKLGDHVMIAPPAVITKEEIQWAVNCLAEAIDEARKETM